MKLVMPVVVNGATLLDADAIIDSERILDRIINAGVKKIDVHRSYLRELAKAYPEFYEKHLEKMTAAKTSGLHQRISVAEEWGMARSLKPKAPAIGLLANPIDLPDVQALMSPYFTIGHSGQSYRELAGQWGSMKLLMVWVDGYTEDELKYMENHLKKENPDLKTLALVSAVYNGNWPSIRWLGNGIQAFRAAFLTVYPKFKDRVKMDFYGSDLSFTSYPKLHIITDATTNREVDPWLKKWSGWSVVVNDIDEKIKRVEAKLTIISLENTDQDLSERLKNLAKAGVPLKRSFIVCHKIAKEEVPELKNLGRLMLQVGQVDNEKLNAVLQKLSA
jgi:hypothetical protein